MPATGALTAPAEGAIFHRMSAAARPLAKKLFGLAMRAVPRGGRFAVAMLLASAAAPLVRRSDLFRGVRRYPFNSARDVALHVVLAVLNRSGIGFEPRLRFEGLEKLDAARAAGRGLLLVGPHTHLTSLAVRHLHDSGYGMTVVTMGPVARRVGSRTALPVIPLSPHFLLEVREALLAGGMVFAMIDRVKPVAGMTVPVETAAGTVHVADALVRLAARCGVGVAFIASRREGRGVACTLDVPAAGEEAAGGLVRFLRAYADRQ